MEAPEKQEEVLVDRLFDMPLFLSILETEGAQPFRQRYDDEEGGTITVYVNRDGTRMTEIITSDEDVLPTTGCNYLLLLNMADTARVLFPNTMRRFDSGEELI